MRDGVARTAATALTVALLVQTIRVAFPLLYDVREDAGAGTAVGWALGAFVLVPAVLAATLRPIGRTGIRIAVVGLAASRTTEQFLHPIPVWLGAAGVAIGLTALLLLLLEARSRGEGTRAGVAGVAVVAGLALDTTLLGAFETWDAVWQDGPAARAVGVVLPVSAIGAAWIAPGDKGVYDADAWPMLLVGPFLLLHLLFLQNVAFGTSEMGVVIAGGVALVLLGDVLGVLAASALAPSARSAAHAATGIVLVLAVAVLALADGKIVALAVPVGSAAAAATLALALTPPASGAATGSPSRSIGAFVVGTALFVGGAFAYQIDIDVPLPVPRSTWPLAAAVVLTLGAFRRHRPAPVSAAPALVPVVGAVAVPLLLVLGLGGSPEPVPPSAGYRLLDWNIHTAVDGDGQIVLGDVLELIEAQDPDVLVLQEVGRGWPIAGQVDGLGWLARHLDMEYLWAPAADGQFGNAILSRFPLELDRILELPYGEGPQERSAIGATVGSDPGLFVVGVHLQHGDRPATRTQQLAVVLDAWGGTDAWVLAGDLNLQPGEDDLTLLEDAGLASVQDLIGDPSAPTARNPLVPDDRVDWIWVTPDTLEVSNFGIPRSEASDHLPLVVEVTPAR